MEDSKLHMRITFEVFGQKYVRSETTYCGEEMADVEGLENKLLDFKKELNASGFKEAKSVKK